MKKVLIGLLVFLMGPFVVNAADYKITDFLINSEIQENGDLKVNELIVLDGVFNGYERDIKYKNSSLIDSDKYDNNARYNASDITDISIKAKYVESVNFDTFNSSGFDNFIDTSYALNGDKAKYVLSDLYDGYRMRMYYPSNNSSVAFYISYTVKDAVVKHNDVAELYWTFIPNGFEDNLNNIAIRVHLPGTDNSDNFKLWAHGNLSGEINKINNTGVEAYISEVMPGEAVDIRLTFDKDLVGNVLKTYQDDALVGIIEVETERANVANALREKLLGQYNTSKYLAIGGCIIIGFLVFLIYFKYGKSPKSGYYSKYNREFIDEYNVEIVDYLMNRNITPNAMSASIMNLIYKKNISAQEIPDAKKKKEKQYLFTLENENNLDDSEQMLVNFLFNTVGKKEENVKTFSTIDLKNYAKGTKTCTKFIDSYNKWKKNVIQKGENQKFYEKSGIPTVIGIFALIFCFTVFIYSLKIETDFILCYFMLPIGLIFFIYTLMVIKKSIKGAEHYDKWKAFKNFLNDFGTFELKELPEIILWERYLVYATVFGLAEKVSKTMNVHISELEVANSSIDYFPMYLYMNLGSSLNSSMNSALQSAYSRQSANYANSHSSSSSGGGFGGGFSSGGGFGGGGGGGRGF